MAPSQALGARVLWNSVLWRWDGLILHPPTPIKLWVWGLRDGLCPALTGEPQAHISQAAEGAGARGLALLSGRMGRAPTWAAGEVWGSGRWAVASRPSSQSVVRGFRGVQPPPSSTPNHKGGWCKALWHRNNEAQSVLAGMNPRPPLASSPLSGPICWSASFPKACFRGALMG